MNNLLIRDNDNNKQTHNNHRNRKHIPKGKCPGGGQDDQHLLCGIGCRRERVGCKNSQADPFTNRLVGFVRSLKRTANKKMTNVTRRFLVCSTVNEGGTLIVFRVNHGYVTLSTLQARDGFLQYQ